MPIDTQSTNNPIVGLVEYITELLTTGLGGIVTSIFGGPTVSAALDTKSYADALEEFRRSNEGRFGAVLGQSLEDVISQGLIDPASGKPFNMLTSMDDFLTSLETAGADRLAAATKLAETGAASLDTLSAQTQKDFEDTIAKLTGEFMKGAYGSEDYVPEGLLPSYTGGASRLLSEFISGVPGTPGAQGIPGAADILGRFGVKAEELREGFGAKAEEITKGYGEREQAITGKFREDRAAVEALLQERLAKGMGMLEGAGAQERRDISEAYGRVAAQQQQELVSRGLGGSGVGAALSLGTAREERGSQGRLEERLRQQRLNTYSGLSADLAAGKQALAAAQANLEASLSGERLGAEQSILGAKTVLGQNLLTQETDLRTQMRGAATDLASSLFAGEQGLRSALFGDLTNLTGTLGVEQLGSLLKDRAASQQYNDQLRWNLWALEYGNLDEQREAKKWLEDNIFGFVTDVQDLPPSANPFGSAYAAGQIAGG